MVANSFHSLPEGAELSRGVLLDFVLWGKWLFNGALMIAMTAVVALMIVNIAFGVMTRASPQRNIFAIGFPITIGSGFVIMIVTLSYFSSKFTLLVEELFLFLQRALVYAGTTKAQEGGQERTEEATPKRQREAREKGQVARSRALTSILMK